MWKEPARQVRQEAWPYFSSFSVFRQQVFSIQAGAVTVSKGQVQPELVGRTGRAQDKDTPHQRMPEKIASLRGGLRVALMGQRPA